MRRPENILCIFSRVLGGKTFSGQAMRALERIGGVKPRFVFLEEEDYATYGREIPFANRMTRMFIGSEIIRLKLKRNPPPPCDALMVQSFELLPACRGFDPSLPVVLAHDSTNVLSYRLIRDQNPSIKSGLLCWLKETAVTPVFRRHIPRVRAFLPRTRWCADSLVKDFGVDRRRIAVIPSGLDVDTWGPPEGGRHGEIPVLLFVGNDFARKGGPFLLDLFDQRLRQRARLRIVSNDPCLRGRRPPPNVEIIQGLHPSDRAAMLSIFQSSDIFVFPTRKDQMGQALVEAASAGLPVVASNVGGVSEVVRDGENGRLLPRGASQEDWTQALIDLADDREKRLRYGRRGRELAEKEFSQEALRNRLEWALEEVVR
jgi:glycosyltransferase involved in cell wall biosynthesis